MRAHMAFDTLAYANRLKAAGVEPKIAEAQAEANAEMIAVLLNDGLATKQDLLLLKQDLQSLELKFTHELQQLELRMESKFDAKLDKVSSELEYKILETKSELKQDMKDLETRLTLRLGGIVIGSITLATTILSVLHITH